MNEASPSQEVTGYKYMELSDAVQKACTLSDGCYDVSKENNIWAIVAECTFPKKTKSGGGSNADLLGPCACTKPPLLPTVHRRGFFPSFLHLLIQITCAA
jgi:hypothetical protein